MVPLTTYAATFAAFLAGRIRFPSIVRTVADVLNAADQWAAEPATVDDVLDAQDWARARARQLLTAHDGVREDTAQEVAPVP